MSKTEVPVIFKGQARFYRVIGVQGDVFYGLNLEVSNHQSGKMGLILALACIGDPPDDTPFMKRGHGPYLMAYEENPPPDTKPIVVQGWRLNKVEHVLGKHLSAFEGTEHLMAQIPVMKTWLDETLEGAGIVPLYNDVGEIFQYFFGKENLPGGERYALKLEPLVKAQTPVEELPALDFSKYGKGGTTVDNDTGEILPDDPMLKDAQDASTDTHHKPLGWSPQSDGGPIDDADADAADPGDI